MSRGPFVDPIPTIANVTEIPVATTAVVYTKSMSLKLGEYFALGYKATSDGDVKLKIELEQSYRRPTTEEASDTAYVVSESVTSIETALADEDWHYKKIEPVALPFARLKITGLASTSPNDASTTIQLKLGKLDLT